VNPKEAPYEEISRSINTSTMNDEPTPADIAHARECMLNTIATGESSLSTNAQLVARYRWAANEHDRRQMRAICDGHRELAESLQKEVATLRASLANALRRRTPNPEQVTTT
jgi:hypothetical protein